MCSKLEGIFKDICITTWTHMHEYVCMEWHVILIPKKSETHETLVDVMSCHQDDVVKKLACLMKVWTHTPLTNRATHQKARGSEREQCMFDDEQEIASSDGLQLFFYA